MDCIVHGILQVRILEWVAFPFSRGSSQSRDQPRSPTDQPRSPTSLADLYQLSHKGSPRILEWVAYPFSRESSWPRNQTGVACIAGRFFTNGAIREAPTWGGVNSLNYNSPLHIGIYTAKNNLTSVNPQTRAQKKWKSRNWEISDCFGNRRNFF